MKPGEYELPPLVDWPKGAPLQDIEDYGEKTIAAVEKAHAERNCRNCGDANCMFPKTLFLPQLVNMGVKCNDWKPKDETNNADA